MFNFLNLKLNSTSNLGGWLASINNLNFIRINYYQ